MWLKFIEPIDRVIDGVSMYRLLLYYLVGLLLAGMGLSFAGVIHYSGINIAISAAILVFASYVINKIFAYLFDAPINPESSILTGLILALIVPPEPTQTGLLFLLAAAGLAIASKYILTIKRKHIFNPAAIAVVLTALGPRQSASWWVGTATMLPFVLVGGLLIARKVRRERMVTVFVVTTTIVTAILSITAGSHVASDLKNMVLNSAVFFLGFVMLTEPYTSPTTQTKQVWYAILVGALMAPQVHLGNYYTTPEVALIIGNAFSFITGSRTKLFPTLFRKYKIAKDTAEFAFMSEEKLSYKPGQYMEFTLPHDKPDSRGSRRYFTLSSSPTEEYLKVGVKFYEPGSSYKSALLDIDQNTPMVASQLAGDFVMPDDPTVKLAFIAGGIGITPFRSMLKYLIDTNEQRDIVLLYSAKDEADIAYRQLLEEAREKLGVNVIYLLTDRNARATNANTHNEALSEATIRRLIPDYEERMVYISGTHPMVESLQETLHLIGANHANIKVDFFPGYA